MPEASHVWEPPPSIWVWFIFARTSPRTSTPRDGLQAGVSPHRSKATRSTPPAPQNKILSTNAHFQLRTRNKRGGCLHARVGPGTLPHSCMLTQKQAPPSRKACSRGSGHRMSSLSLRNRLVTSYSLVVTKKELSIVGKRAQRPRPVGYTGGA